MLTNVSLFSGMGGIDLAAEAAGIETVCFVESDAFCQRGLRKNWPHVPIIGDVHDATKETIQEAIEAYRERGARGPDGPGALADAHAVGRKEGHSKSEIRYGQPDTRVGGGDVSDAPGLRGPAEQRDEPDGAVPGHGGSRRTARADWSADIVSGGFPCQPVSIAGRRRGKEDDRWLWPEMLRVIREIRSTWVVAENVAGLVHMGLSECLSDLEGAGYEVTTLQIPACAVGAPHRRDRIFIVAHAVNGGPQERRTEDDAALSRRRGRGAAPSVLGPASPESSSDVSDARPGRHGASERQVPAGRFGSFDSDWWAAEPDVGRVAHGVPHRVDRLRTLGNAVVPPQIYRIFAAIALIEGGHDAD